MLATLVVVSLALCNYSTAPTVDYTVYTFSSLSESGYTVTFADINERIINLLNAAHHYSLEILSENHTTHIIRRVEGIISTSPDVVDLLARTGEGSVDLITTRFVLCLFRRLAI